MKMFVKLKRLRKPRRRQKWNIERLKKNSIPFQKNVEDIIKPNSGRNVNERWTECKSAVPSSAQKEIGYEKKERARKPWITEEMINKMNEIRKWNSKNNEEGRKMYRQINNKLRRETDKARTAYWIESVRSWKN
jgi:hypothetical protein